MKNKAIRKICTDFFPEWKKKALTFSYDDGALSDQRLIGIFNDNGLSCTFNISSSFIGNDDKYMTFADLKTISETYEIACHTYSHKFVTSLGGSELFNEISADKRILEEKLGILVSGLAYPFGVFNDAVIDAAKHCGIKYCRTVNSTGKFRLPDDFYVWNPTCHHTDAARVLRSFDDIGKDLRLFYVWGHSFEFDRAGNWEEMEKFCRALRGREDVFFATNADIYDYVSAVRSLVFNCDFSVCKNPSATPVYAECDGNRTIIRPGINYL